MDIFKNKTILITGGTGSFGSYFVNFLLKNTKSNKIIIYSRDEFKQYNMKNSIHPKYHEKLRFFIGDVRDLSRLEFATNEVDILVHSAAMKQVEASEYNPMECVKTNITGTENVIKACIASKISKAVLVSTDKAVNPINLYGSTKLASEKIFLNANNLVGKNNLKFSVVRYGNVAGSRGSVIPFFLDLIKEGKNSFPITDNKMTRFWISLDHAAKFVKMSIENMNGGEIFVPKLYSFYIKDLPKALHLNPKIKIIGKKKGEKLSEVMISKEESEKTLEYKNYYKILMNENYSFKDRNKKKNKFIKKIFEYDSTSNTKKFSLNDLRKKISSEL
jgi:UDP-N-acetylglucosamine 4,6-dehydratase